MTGYYDITKKQSPEWRSVTDLHRDLKVPARESLGFSTESECMCDVFALPGSLAPWREL